MDGKDEDAFRQQVGAVSQDAEDLESVSALAFPLLSKLAGSEASPRAKAHVPGAHLDKLSALAGAHKKDIPKSCWRRSVVSQGRRAFADGEARVGQRLVFHITRGRVDGAKTGKLQGPRKLSLAVFLDDAVAEEGNRDRTGGGFDKVAACVIASRLARRRNLAASSSAPSGASQLRGDLPRRLGQWCSVCGGPDVSHHVPKSRKQCDAAPFCTAVLARCEQ